MHSLLPVAIAAITLACLIRSPIMAQPATRPVDTVTVARYDVFEVTLASDETFADPFVDGKARATFRGPSDKKVEVAGFYDGDGKWRVRFAPNEVGAWSYSRGTGGREEDRDSGRASSAASSRRITASCGCRR